MIRRIHFGAKNNLGDKDNIKDKKLCLNNDGKLGIENIKKVVNIYLNVILSYNVCLYSTEHFTANTGSKVGTLRLRQDEGSIVHDTIGSHDSEKNNAPTTSTKLF